MGASRKRRYTITAEPGIDWNAVVDTIETIAASAYIEVPKQGDGTTAYAFVHTYREPFDKDDVAAVMDKHPQITKMTVGGWNNKPDRNKTTSYFGTG